MKPTWPGWRNPQRVPDLLLHQRHHGAAAHVSAHAVEAAARHQPDGCRARPALGMRSGEEIGMAACMQQGQGAAHSCGAPQLKGCRACLVDG
jgi:hypothetical protein